ncbi:MAG: hypothetical protein QM398_08235 [Thermoproteota archaeon]|nr:hypothetical protein [Thermoproteota archaeon]NLD67076.1 hypothetical protein [Thermoproteota archaeon]
MHYCILFQSKQIRNRFWREPPELESRVHKTANKYEETREFVDKHVVELVEVHNWGFYGFGQLVGKSEVFKKYWSTNSVLAFKP